MMSFKTMIDAVEERLLLVYYDDYEGKMIRTSVRKVDLDDCLTENEVDAYALFEHNKLIEVRDLDCLRIEGGWVVSAGGDTPPMHGDEEVSFISDDWGSSPIYYYEDKGCFGTISRTYDCTEEEFIPFPSYWDENGIKSLSTDGDYPVLLVTVDKYSQTVSADTISRKDIEKRLSDENIWGYAIFRYGKLMKSFNITCFHCKKGWVAGTGIKPLPNITVAMYINSDGHWPITNEDGHIFSIYEDTGSGKIIEIFPYWK